MRCVVQIRARWVALGEALLGRPCGADGAAVLCYACKCVKDENAAELRCIDGDVVYEKGNTWVHLQGGPSLQLKEVGGCE